MLGFGRALGETMAVTMVIGNTPKAEWSLFAPQYTMAAVIANEFSEADTSLYLSALVEIGLVLFIITLIVNAMSRSLRLSRLNNTHSLPWRMQALHCASVWP
jgi:phosphate transport system permease protein